MIEGEGVSLRLIVGEMAGRVSPVKLPMETIYAEAQLAAGARLVFDARYAERAIYVCDGEIEIDGEALRIAAVAGAARRPGRDLKALTAGAHHAAGRRAGRWAATYLVESRCQQQ